MNETSDTFTAAVTMVFGIMAWVQFPALCGFMFSSTRAGPANYGYSLLLGAFIAAIGLVSAFRRFVAGPRGALLVAGVALNVGFILTAILAQDSTGATCRALFAYAQ